MLASVGNESASGERVVVVLVLERPSLARAASRGLKGGRIVVVVVVGLLLGRSARGETSFRASTDGEEPSFALRAILKCSG